MRVGVVLRRQAVLLSQTVEVRHGRIANDVRVIRVLLHYDEHVADRCRDGRRRRGRGGWWGREEDGVIACRGCREACYYNEEEQSARRLAKNSPWEGYT